MIFIQKTEKRLLVFCSYNATVQKIKSREIMLRTRTFLKGRHFYLKLLKKNIAVQKSIKNGFRGGTHYSDEEHYSLVKVRDISSLRCEQ